MCVCVFFFFILKCVCFYKNKKQNKKQKQKQEQRLPAWCDRILVRSIEGFPIETLEYDSVESAAASDHKPVFCKYRLQTWRRACGKDDSIKSAKIHFRNVSATGIIPADAIQQKSDPFIHFPRQLLLARHCQSKRVNRVQFFFLFFFFFF